MRESGHSQADLPGLGRALQHLRRQRQMSADELASAVGIERRRIDALEAGRVDPGYELLLALADTLGVQPSALVILAERLSGSHEGRTRG